MENSISICIDELIERLQLAKTEGYSIAKLEISGAIMDEDKTLIIRVYEPVSGETSDFGLLTYEDGEM